MKKLKPVYCFPKTNCFVISFFLLQFILPAALNAQGNLLIMPKRVVFEGSKKYDEISLANTGKDTARYVISIVHYRMKEDGSFEEITEPGPGENFADKYVRFFPRSVTLGPDESQVVKIQLNRNNELVAGEYRSHIYFRAIPNAAPLGETAPAKDSSISIKLVPVFGISIPVIIRVGDINTTVSLSAPSMEITEDTTHVLNLTFQRTGNMSVYGDLAVDYISDQGKRITAGNIKGIAVYTPNAQRHFKVNLENNSGINYHSGKLHITYSAPAESKKATLAETELVLH
ncbi:MAG: hypothetical protein QM726_25475 [Chitinophagaceae bacterium]